MDGDMISTARAYVARHRLLQPGDRVAVAVSGGADSVALLDVMLELRKEMGLVLSVAHFNHQIRGAESDADQQFVSDLAAKNQLEFFSSSGDAPSRAQQNKESLETAAGELRYSFFRGLLAAGKANKIALAHTKDDQAETVLMRFLRGAGTRGLAGIYPEFSEDGGAFIRPLLDVRRCEIENFLRARNQAWRDDSTNQQTIHTRNKVRHELLPKLREFNPAIVENLAHTAEVARAEEEYWHAEAHRILPLLLLPGKATRGGGRTVTTSTESKPFGLDIQQLGQHPLALQRRLIRAAAETLALDLDLEHVEAVLKVANREVVSAELPQGWRLSRSLRELRFERTQNISAIRDYDLRAPIPGTVPIPDINVLVRLHLMPLTSEDASYNRATLHPPEVLWNVAGTLKPIAPSTDLRIRNWHDGDRFRPANSAGEKKVKDLLKDLKVPRELRRGWPVLSS